LDVSRLSLFGYRNFLFHWESSHGYRISGIAFDAVTFYERSEGLATIRRKPETRHRDALTVLPRSGRPLHGAAPVTGEPR
jgi:hypothetical protein